MYSRQQLQQVTIYSAPHVLSRFFPACPDLMPDHFPMCSFQKVPYLDTPLYAQHPPYILLHALPAGKGGFCIRLLHSIGAADIDLDDAWDLKPLTAATSQSQSRLPKAWMTYQQHQRPKRTVSQ